MSAHVCGYYGNRLEAGGGVGYANETAGGTVVVTARSSPAIRT